MKVEMFYRIMKQLLERHKFIEVGIPSGWIIHAVLPLLILNGIYFFQKREKNAVEDSSGPFRGKNLTLPARTEGIEPVERTGQCIEQPGEPPG